MKVSADSLHSFTPTDDALVLASVDSPAEREMLDDWLDAAAARTPRRTHRGAATARRRRPAAGRARAPGRTARSRRRPVRRPGAGVLDARRAAHPVQGGGVPGRPRHLPAAAGVAARHPAQGPVARPGGRRRAREGVRAAAAVGATPRSPRIRATSRVSSCGAQTWRSNASSCGCSVPSTSRRGWSSRRCWRQRAFARDSRRSPAPRWNRPARCSTSSRPGWSRFSVDLIPTLGRAIFSRGFDPNIDYDRAEIEAMRVALENHPAVLLFSHRSYLDGAIVPGGDAGEPAAAGAHVRRHQPVVRVHGAADAALGRHLHPPQARRSAVQVRAEAVRRLHRREAVQPQLVDRGHPLADRKDVAAQARTARLRRRRLPRRAAATTSCCSRCRSASTSCTRPPSTPRTPAAARRRPRACPGCTTSSRRRASATTARSTSASPKPCRCASTSVSRTGR